MPYIKSIGCLTPNGEATGRRLGGGYNPPLVSTATRGICAKLREIYSPVGRFAERAKKIRGGTEYT